MNIVIFPFLRIGNIKNALPDGSRAFLIFFQIFLMISFSADPQKINNFIFAGFVDLMYCDNSLFWSFPPIVCLKH